LPLNCVERNPMDTLSLIQGLRFVDSFFPSGGFAFSSGLEAAVKCGAVHNGKDLAGYVRDLLVHGMAKREAGAVAVAHLAAVTDRLDLALTVDRQLDELKLGRDLRLASRQIGRQVMKGAVGQTHDNGVIRGFRRAIDEGRTPGHVPVAIGMTLAVCGWSRQDTVAAFLYQTAQGFVSAAMKLLPIGQQEGQQLLSDWGPLIAELSRRAKPETNLFSWSPVHDIYAMRHARLESRLFRS
jgi:urease accessory protein